MNITRMNASTATVSRLGGFPDVFGPRELGRSVSAAC